MCVERFHLIKSVKLDIVFLLIWTVTLDQIVHLRLFKNNPFIDLWEKRNFMFERLKYVAVVSQSEPKTIRICD